MWGGVAALIWSPAPAPHLPPPPRPCLSPFRLPRSPTNPTLRPRPHHRITPQTPPLLAFAFARTRKFGNACRRNPTCIKPEVGSAGISFEIRQIRKWTTRSEERENLREIGTESSNPRRPTQPLKGSDPQRHPRCSAPGGASAMQGRAPRPTARDASATRQWSRKTKNARASTPGGPSVATCGLRARSWTKTAPVGTARRSGFR